MRKDRTIGKWSFFLCGLLLTAVPAYAAQYDCLTTRMSTSGESIDSDKVKQGQFSVKVDDKPESAVISRCSFALSAGKVNCDHYEVDKITFDENVKIKKFYVFRSQFDVQIFSDLSFIENNGRGGIAFGTCKIISP